MMYLIRADPCDLPAGKGRSVAPAVADSSLRSKLFRDFSCDFVA